MLKIDKLDDTYEHARALADEQIANEMAVTDELDATERDVLELWDEYIEVPYGRKYLMRVRAELSNNDHIIFCKLLDAINNSSDKSDNIFIDALLMITMGIYDGDKCVLETDRAFWENGTNWNALKIKRIVETYFKYYQEECDKTLSFLDKEATPGNDNS